MRGTRAVGLTKTDYNYEDNFEDNDFEGNDGLVAEVDLPNHQAAVVPLELCEDGLPAPEYCVECQPAGASVKATMQRSDDYPGEYELRFALENQDSRQVHVRIWRRGLQLAPCHTETATYGWAKDGFAG